VFPDQYFALIEQTPISALFFNELLEQVLNDITQYNLPSVSVNVSGYDIRQAGYVNNFLRRLRSSSLDPNKIKVELTERANLSDPIVKKNVRELQENGILICLDDFGEGVSSVKLIPELAPDIIKIDKNWLRYNRKDLRALISYCLQSNCKVVVEGIETDDEMETSKAMGANYGQGFFIARPAPVQMFLNGLKSVGKAS
jgi:EAL domain-containing protein (putative c-di-GMP-specific phosphodiesterase class I)